MHLGASQHASKAAHFRPIVYEVGFRIHRLAVCCQLRDISSLGLVKIIEKRACTHVKGAGIEGLGELSIS